MFAVLAVLNPTKMNIILILLSSYVLCLPIFNEQLDFSVSNQQDLPVSELIYETSSAAKSYHCDMVKDNNPYVLLAQVKNTRGTTIDEYVNTILKHTDITADMILNKAKDSDSWFYKEFIMDPVYMERVHKMHAKIRAKYDDSELELQENFDDLKIQYPHYARVLPIFSSLDRR